MPPLYTPTRLNYTAPLLDSEPAIAGWLTTSRLTTNALGRLASGLKQTFSWLDQQDTFAGVPGFLAGLRLRAENYADTNVRSTALGFIDAISRLPTDQQTAFLAWARSRSQQVTTSRFSGHPVVPGLREGQAAAAGLIENITGLEVDIGREGLEVTPTAGGGVTEDVLAALKSLFPDIAIRISDKPGTAQIIDEMVTSVGTEEWFQETPFHRYVYEKSAGAQRIAQLIKEFNEGRKIGWGELLTFTYSLSQVGFDVTTGALGTLGREIEESTGTNITATAGDFANYALTGQVRLRNEQGEIVDIARTEGGIGPIIEAWAESGYRLQTFGGVGFNIMGELDPNDPDYEEKLEERLAGFGLVTLAIGGIALPAAGRRLQTVRGAIGIEGATAALRAIEATSSIAKRGGVLGVVSEIYKLPLRKIVEALDKQLLRFARDPETWWRSGLLSKKGNTILKTVEAARKKYPDDPGAQMAFVLDAYGGKITPRTIFAMLEQVTADGIRRAFAEAMTNPLTPMKELLSRRNEVQRQLTTLERSPDLPEVEDVVAFEARVQTLLDTFDMPAKQKALLKDWSLAELSDPKWERYALDPDALRDPDFFRDVVESLDTWERTLFENDPRFQEWRERITGVEDPGVARSIAEQIAGHSLEEGGIDFIPAGDWNKFFAEPGWFDADLNFMHTAIRERYRGLEREAISPPTNLLRDESGRPIRLHHGTPFAFRDFEVERSFFHDAYGPGVYLTDDPSIASSYVGPETIEALQRFTSEVQEFRPDLGDVGPNIQFRYLDAAPEEIFQTAKALTIEEKAKILEVIERADFDITEVRDVLQPEGTREASFEQLLAEAVTGENLYESLARVMPKEEINELLKNAGYKAIEYEGGKFTGGRRHRAFVVFDVESLNPPWEFPRLNPADAIAHQAQIDEANRLRLELDSVEWQIKTRPDGSPMLRYPSRSAIRAIVRGTGVNRIERMLSFLTLNRAGIGRKFDLAKTVDELSRRPLLFVPGNSTNPVGWFDHNASEISKYMRLAGVDVKTIHHRVGELHAAKSQREFYELIEHRIFGYGGDIDRALPRSVDPDIRRALVELHDTAIEGRTKSYVQEYAVMPDGSIHKVGRPILAKEINKGEFIPMPSRPSEFLRHLRLPDVDLLREANSFLNRLARRLDRANLPSKVLTHVVYDLPKFVLSIATSILKPTVMIVRIPAMAIRIQMEQALRAQAFGYRPFRGIPEGISLFPGGIPVPFTQTRFLKNLFGEDGLTLLAPDPRLKGFVDPDAADAGMFASEFIDDAPHTIVPESTAEFRTGRRTPKREHYETWRNELHQAHTDPLDHEIVTRNFNRDSILQWLDEDEDMIFYMTNNQQPILDELGVSRATFIDTRINYLKQLTQDNAQFIEALMTGKLRPFDVIFSPGSLPDGQMILDVYNELVDDVSILTDQIRERLRQGFPEGEGPDYSSEMNTIEIAAMQEQRKAKLREMAQLRDEFGGELRDISGGGVDLGDKAGMQRLLKRQWEGAEWEMPDRLMMEKRLREEHTSGGPLDTLRHYNRAISNALYRPLKALTWVDTKGTRGSLFAQAYKRRLVELEARGVPTAEAAVFARAYAGEVTRDLMYDLTARTSVQRSLKNIFWFAPAWQEVLYTWAVKAPAAAYWPVGMLGLASKYVVSKAALKELGVIREIDGEEVIIYPGLSSFVEMVTGEKVPPIAFGKISGLNLVTSGGGVPGISTPASFTLGQLALKHGGLFKALSDVFQPYGPEVSLLPAAIVYGWEAVFGGPPPWEILSPEYQKNRWDGVFNSGIQYAAAELQAEDVLPPRPEQFGVQEADGTWTLTQEQEAAFRKASDEYLIRLMTLGKSYAQGMAGVKFVGATIAPQALYTTSEARQEWRDFFREIIVPEGFGSQGLSDHQKQLIDSFLVDHPQSMAYSVFYSEYGPKERDLPFSETLDDAFYDDYYTGERRTMVPRDFSVKLMAIESQRFYQQQLEKALNDISPERDPWVLLTNGYQRQGALQKYKEAWERYLFLNPEAEAVLLKSRKFWIDQNRVPLRSFEAERLGNTIDSLRQLAPMITGEDAFDLRDVSALRARLQELYSEFESAFGKPITPAEKATVWWFENVMDPYFEDTEKLYAEAERLESLGLSASPVWNQIKERANELPPKYNGETVPTVEEVFFGNRSQVDQAQAILKWQTRPLSWLSNFQMDKAWGDYSKEVRDFLADVASYDNQFWQFVNQSGISFSSREYLLLQAKRDADLLAAAQTIGPEAVEALRLNEAEPAIRLSEAGFGRESSYWQSTVAAAQNIIAQLRAAGLSPKSFSEIAANAKATLYESIERARATNLAYNTLWEQLMDILELPSGVPRDGALLYEAVLFGNFNEDIPYSVAIVGGSGNG